MSAPLNKEHIRQALLDQAESLFETAWGQPAKRGGKEWRAKDADNRKMDMRGTDRGLWHDFTSGQGGDLLDFVAVEFCGLEKARNDFPRVIAEAARLCGIATDQAPDLAQIEAKRRELDRAAQIEAEKEARRDAALIATLGGKVQRVEGTPAAAYLASRGLLTLSPDAGGYLPAMPKTPGLLHPERAALVIWARDDAGKITGGQRILILPDGSKAPEETRKPAFAKIGGTPARFPAMPGKEAEPLLIAEGPESALSVWQVTGLEAWAVFGASSWASAPVPLGRPVILCPDRDTPVGTFPPGSKEARDKESAARAFAEAVAFHLRRGADLRIAYAPEPEGSKRDLNDTLQRAGAEAVAQAIAEAVPATPAPDDTPPPPAPYHPPIEGDRDAYIAKHEATVAAFFEAVLPKVKARKAVAAAYAEIDPLDPARDAKMQAARRDVQERFGADYLPASKIGKPDAGPRWMLSGAQGIGKTTALLSALKRCEGMVSLVLMPDHGKTLQALSEFEALPAPGGPVAVHLLGRGKQDAGQPEGVTMCRLSALADKLSKDGVAVRSTLCPACPSQGQCGYHKQENRIERLASEPAGVVIFAPQEYAMLPIPGKVTPDLVAYDEASRKQWVTPREINLEALSEPLAFDGAPYAKSADAKAAAAADALAANLARLQPLKVAILHAFRDAPGAELDAMRARGFNSARIKEALADLSAFEDHAIKRTLKEAQEIGTFEGLATGKSGAVEARLERAIEGHAGKGVRALRALFEALAVEMETGRAGAVSVQKIGKAEGAGALAIYTLEKPHFTPETPLLHLDGTGAKDLAEAVLGPLEHFNFRVERKAHVTLATGRAFSNSSLCGDLRDKSPLTGKWAAEAAKLRAEVVAFCHSKPGFLVVGNKAVIEALLASGLSNPVAHFGALRGRNDWEAAPGVIVIGREEPSPEGVEKTARAYAARDSEPFQSIAGDKWHKQGRAVRMADGSNPVIEVSCHPNRWADLVLRQIRDAEILQALDRARLIFLEEPKPVFILGETVADVTVSECLKWIDLKQGGERVAQAMERFGVLPLSSREALRLLPALWKSEKTARCDIAPEAETVARLLRHFPNNTLLFGKGRIKDATLCEYQAAPKEGGRSRLHRALVVAPPADARAKLEALTGPLQHFALVPEWEALRAHIADREERAAIAEYDGGLDRPTAELVAIGRAMPTPANAPEPPPAIELQAVTALTRVVNDRWAG